MKISSPRKKETRLKNKKVPNEVFINRLKKARASCGKTQAKLAEELNKEPGTVSTWEQGKAFPDTETLLKIPNVLNCDLDYLIGRIDETTHELQMISERTGLSTKTINLLIESKKMSERLKNSDIINDYPAYLFDERLSLGEVISEIVENKHAGDLLDNLKKLILTDKFYAFWMRNSTYDSSWIADSPDELWPEHTITIGSEIITEETYFDFIQYKTTVLFQKVLEDITNRKESLTLEEVKHFVPNIKDDTEAREILRILELQRQTRKNKKRKEV